MPDSRVQAIRDNEKVGRGSCSSIDECYEDHELADMLDKENIKTPRQAVKWAIRHEGLHLEQGLNQRWGEDNDPQLEAYKRFHNEN